MWFGAKPKQSRAAPMAKQLTDTQIILQRQRQIQNEIQAFIQQDKQKNELLADRIQDLANFQKDQQQKHQEEQKDRMLMINNSQTSSSFLPPIFAHSSSSINNSVVEQQQPTSHSASNLTVVSPPHPPLQQPKVFLTPAQTLQRSPLDRRLASLVTVDILNTCANLVKGIDSVLTRNKEGKTKSTVKIGASNALPANQKQEHNNNTKNKNINHDSHDNDFMMRDFGSASQSQPNDNKFILKSINSTNNRIQSMTRQHRGGPTVTSSNSNTEGGGTSHGKNTDHVSSILDQEELEDELKRMRKICHEDCYLEDDVCSVVGGYGADPFPAQLASTASVVQSVAEIVSDSTKVSASSQEMMSCLDECNSLRRDMILMRRFKRNCIRTNFHARKILSWANQCRTHMFIFNNTINQIGREAAEDLRKGKERKLEQQHRTAELILKLQETESELAILKKEVDELVVVHGEMEQKLLDTYTVRNEEKRYSETQLMGASSGSPLFVQSTMARPKSPFGASLNNGDTVTLETTFSNASPSPSNPNNNNNTSTNNLLSANTLGTASTTMMKKGSFQYANQGNNNGSTANSAQTSAAHRAFEKMSVSAVELHLLLQRYVMMMMMVNEKNPLSEKVLMAIKRVTMTIEQSVDVEKINLFGNASELYHI